MKTTTLTASLVRNQKLHLTHNNNTPKCAGRRYGSPVVTAAVEVEDLPVGLERAVANAAAWRVAEKDLAAKLSESLREQLCEKCAVTQLSEEGPA